MIYEHKTTKFRFLILVCICVERHEQQIKQARDSIMAIKVSAVGLELLLEVQMPVMAGIYKMTLGCVWGCYCTLFIWSNTNKSLKSTKLRIWKRFGEYMHVFSFCKSQDDHSLIPALLECLKSIYFTGSFWLVEKTNKWPLNIIIPDVVINNIFNFNCRCLCNHM